MFSGAVLTILTGVTWAAVAGIYSAAAERQKNYIGFMFCYMSIFAILVWIFQFPSAAPLNEILKVACIIAPGNICSTVGFYLLFIAMRKGSHTVAWTITQTAMIVPFLGGWLILDDRISAINLAGLFLIVSALILLGTDKSQKDEKKQNRIETTILLSFIAMILVGLAQFSTILPSEKNGFSGEALTWRLPVNAICGLLTWAGVAAVKRSKIDRPAVKWGVWYAFFVTIGQILFFLSVDSMAKFSVSGIVYPVSISLSILLFAVYRAIFRREKIKPLIGVGLFLLFLGVAAMFVPKS